MFQVIGVLTVWLFVASLVFYIPIRTSVWWANTGEEVGDIILGFYAGVASLGIYIVATVIYFVVT
jgi:hypothetical protein